MRAYQLKPPLNSIGFLGGTFDPPHAGHLALAHAAREVLGLAQVRFVPTAQPWQKPQVTPAVHRLRMLELALKDEPGFTVDRREIKRADASYTVDTLQALRRELGEKIALVWIIGSDQLARLNTWHQWEKLLTLAHLAVASRQGEPVSGAMQAYYAQHQATATQAMPLSRGHFIDIAMQPVDISATTLRDLLARPSAALNPLEQQQLTQALRPAVLDYIRAHALYGSRL